MLDEATSSERAIDRRRAQMRHEILAAAWQLCREQGLSALSLRELASRVGMRAPSLYSYFDSKHAIYDAMFAQGHRELAAHMAFLPDSGLTRDDFRAAARAWFDFCVSDPVRHQLLFQRTIPGFEPSRESYALAVDLLERLRTHLVEMGVGDPRHLDLWTALLSGLTAQQISNEPGGERWGRLLDEAVDLFCDHVGVPRSGAAAEGEDRPCPTPT